MWKQSRRLLNLLVGNLPVRRIWYKLGKTTGIQWHQQLAFERNNAKAGTKKTIVNEAKASRSRGKHLVGEDKNLQSR